MALTTKSANRKDIRTGKAGMDHRHFCTIATIISGMRDYLPGDTGDRVAKHFADELASTNPRFDRLRFLAACEKR